MSNYRKGSHSVFSIHLHLVWITKYRKKILSGDIAQSARSLLRRQYWGRHMWARGYFCCSSGNVTDEVIKQYIAQQEDADETFRIEGE